VVREQDSANHECTNTNTHGYLKTRTALFYLLKPFYLRIFYAVVGVQLKDFSIMEYYTNNRI
jgi:hypothetical protein